MTSAPLTPRATTYNGIKMRSRLEAAHAEQFDAFGWPWRYEPECFASNGGQYLPDFWAPPQSITYDATQASLMGFG